MHLLHGVGLTGETKADAIILADKPFKTTTKVILGAFSEFMARFLSLQENPASPVMALMGEMVREALLEPPDPLVFQVLLALQVLLVFVNHQLVPWKLDYKEG